MKFHQQVVVPVACEPLWEFLMDIPRVAKALPGVDSVTAIDESTYQGTLKVKVGPISLSLKGKIVVESRDREALCATLRMDASDRLAAGGVMGRTTMSLKPLGAQETELSVETDVNILGKIGEFGQPIIRKKADRMLGEFVENIRKQLGASS